MGAVSPVVPQCSRCAPRQLCELGRVGEGVKTDSNPRKQKFEIREGQEGQYTEK